LGLNQLSMLKEIALSFKEDFVEFKKDATRTKYLM
jgi:hypothetical protein